MRSRACGLVAVVVTFAPAQLLAQNPDTIARQLVSVAEAAQAPDAERPEAQAPSQSADTTRQQLQRILFQLPPAVRNVLRSDPTLAERADYLAPYPELAAFLQQHPEVARNPAFFFGLPGEFQRDSSPVEVFAGILAGTALFVFAMTVLIIFGAVLRQVVHYRRWVRQTRMQADVHTKILDRLQSNDELLAYIQTPAGRQFLEFAPVAVDDGPRPAGVPFGRILWSVQAGVVLAALGIGLRLAQRTVPDEIVPGLSVLAVIVTALGLGALVSAAVAYFLSARLGLLPPPRPSA